MRSYFANTGCQGEPLFQQITPIILLAWKDVEPISGPFRARFSGGLRIREPGGYGFRIEADDGVRLVSDCRVLAEGLVQNQPDAIHASAALTAAGHPIQIDYFQNCGGRFPVFRQPSGCEASSVPPTAPIPQK